MAMDFAIKLPYHKRLFLAVFVLSWTTIAGFIVFQYIREKQYKSEYLSARLQAYNHNLLETVEYGLSYEDYINTYTKPFDSLQGPRAPGWGRQHHSQRETPFVPSKRLPDWASLVRVPWTARRSTSPS